MADPCVLVVDDSPILLRLLESVLTGAGLSVRTAADGQSALALAAADPPQLILLDDVLPDLSLDEVCDSLARNPTTADIPVVLLLSGSHETPVTPARIVDAISKPFTPDALRALVSHILTPSFGEQRGAEPHPPLALTPQEELALPPVLPDLGGCALAGDLGAIPISEILALIQDRQITGILTVTRDKARIQMYLRMGLLDFATAVGVPEEFLLGRFLVERGFLGQSELSAILDDERRRGPRARRLGLALMERGLIEPAQLAEAVRLQTAALAYETLRLTSGTFALDARASSPWPEAAHAARAGLSIEHVLMEGLRRIDEWRIIEREIDDFDAVFVREEDRFRALGPGQLLRDEITVARLVDGKSTVKDIIAASRMGSFDVSRILFRLLRNKLIRRRVPPVAI